MARSFRQHVQLVAIGRCVFVLPLVWAACPFPLFAQPTSSSEQADQAWSVPQTPWGDPDLQGLWTNRREATTPLERPIEFGTRRLLTDEEWEAREEASQREWGPRAFRGVDVGIASRRTSRIIDPANGRFPELTRGGQERAAALAEATERMAGPEDAPLYSRCLTRGVLSMLPTFSNMYYQIVQTPEYVAILYEQIRFVRIIPMDGRSHIAPQIRLWMGDPLGHWEDATLVVETTNFRDGSMQAGFVASDVLHVVERFTRVAPDEIEWEATVTDPKVYTKPITVALPIRNDEVPEQIFEYACHEGNRSLTLGLRGSRIRDAEMAAKNLTEATPTPPPTHAEPQ